MLGHIIVAVAVLIFIGMGLNVNIYHANFRATDPRPGRQGKSWKFAAADDATAGAVAAELGNWQAGQLTSLYGKVGGQGTQNTYNVGTRYTANCLIGDASGNVFRVNVRNVQNYPGTVAALTACFLGTAYTDANFAIAAMSGPCILPNSNNPCTVVKSISIVNKG